MTKQKQKKNPTPYILQENKQHKTKITPLPPRPSDPTMIPIYNYILDCISKIPKSNPPTKIINKTNKNQKTQNIEQKTYTPNQNFTPPDAQLKTNNYKISTGLLQAQENLETKNSKISTGLLQAQEILGKCNEEIKFNLQPKTTSNSIGELGHKSDWPKNALDVIRNIATSTSQRPKKSQFNFNLNEKYAEHNWIILSKFKIVGETIEHEGNSPLQYGSEFRPADQLEPLFKFHPLWNRMKEILKRVT